MLWLKLNVCLAVFSLATLAQGSSTAKNSFLRGPGLYPDKIVLPCRYFIVELRSKDDQRLSEDQVSEPEVSILGHSPKSQSPISVRHEVLNLYNSSFLIRYKTFSSFLGLSIEVKISGEHVQGSPVQIEDPVHPSGCRCPSPDFLEWLQDYGCDAPEPQLDKDLEAFAKINMPKVIQEAKERFSQRGAFSFCHYVIKDRLIYRECYGEHVGFKMFPDAFLTFLSHVVDLPNVEFLINLGDWPLSKKRTGLKPIPMVSWCKTDDFYDILLPTYELTEASLECMGRQSLDLFTAMSRGNAKVDWHHREEKAFFRGRDSNRARLTLAKLGKSHPDQIDSGITRYFFFRDQESSLGTKDQIPFHDFFQYKYQLNVDGTVAAYRFPFLMTGGSTVMKQDSGYYEHFYSQLQPWQHFIPVQEDLSDLLDQIEWAKSHDVEAQNMAKAAKAFAADQLHPQRVICYHAKLLQSLSKRLITPVTITSSMDKVEEEPSRYLSCQCDLKSKSKKDKDKETHLKEEL